MKSLQYQFIDSQGKPLIVGNKSVVQLDSIKLSKGIVQVALLSALDGKHGVCLKTDKGDIFLSDGSKCKRVEIWNEPNLPTVIEHEVCCKTGELKVWNVYRITHQNGSITEDSWTGDAGMVVRQIEANKRIYECSDGIGDFDPTDFQFEITW